MLCMMSLWPTRERWTAPGRGDLHQRCQVCRHVVLDTSRGGSVVGVTADYVHLYFCRRQLLLHEICFGLPVTATSVCFLLNQCILKHTHTEYY